MFESILIRPNSSRSHPLDYGQMIENLFFYNKTIVHIGRNEIRTLFDLVDVYVLEELLKLSYLEVYYNNSHCGIINRDGILSLDSFGLADVDIEKELYEESYKYRHDKSRSKKFAKKLSRLIKIYELPNALNKSFTEQVKDEKFRRDVLIETVKRFPPIEKVDLDKLRYELEFIDDLNFKIHTNIPFDEKNSTSDTTILSIINCVEDMQVMSEFSSEISLPEYNSAIIRIKTNSLLNKTIKFKKEIEVFNHYVFDESWALREAINNKDLHVKAILPALRNAQKYKEWLHELPSDSNLMREYQEKVEEKNILESLPFKAIKFYLFTGIETILGYVNPEISIPISLGLNAFDTFLFDNIYKQWKPNQFIEKELRPLIKKE